MSEVSRKLTLEQISKDIHAVSVQCDDRAEDDEKFRQEVRRTDTNMQETLEKILTKLDPGHEDYINRAIENKLDPDHEEYILRETNEKVDQLWVLFQGLSFAGNAIKYTAGIVAGLSVIIVSVFAAIRFIK